MRLATTFVHVIALLAWVCTALRDSRSSREYGVVVDAGSSASKIRVYQWEEKTDRYQLSAIREVFSNKTKPGISAYSEQLLSLRSYVSNLIDQARAVVPRGKHARTSIYLLATAGMRLLLEDKANAVMDALHIALLDEELNPFKYDGLNTRIISGEEEGAFAWIAVNYLKGFFSGPMHTRGSLSAGVLELGGASTQIIFQHGGSILADKFPVKIAGTTYPLYVHSYLYYGQEYVVRWTQEQLLSNNPPDTGVVDNPCMLKGDFASIRLHERNVTFRGIGRPHLCTDLLHNLVYKVDDWRCHPKPCAIGTVYQPSISTNQTFFAVSAFVFSLQTLGVLRPDNSFTPRETREAAVSFCQKHISDIREEMGSANDFLSTECLMGVYMSLLFTKGYGFSNDTTKLYAAKKINDIAAEWPLGAIIYENERKDSDCVEYPPPRVGAVSSSSGFIRQGHLLVLLANICLFQPR